MPEDKEEVILNLMKHPGITRAKAEKLYSEGVRTIEDILIHALPGLDADKRKKIASSVETSSTTDGKDEKKEKAEKIKASIEQSMAKYKSKEDENLRVISDENVRKRLLELQKSTLGGEIIEVEELSEDEEKEYTINELCKMPGINRENAERLYKLGFRSLADLIQQTMGKDEDGQVLSMILAQQITGDETLKKIIGEDKKIIDERDHLLEGLAAEESIRELMLIPGIDREKAIKLRKKGIFRISDLLTKTLGAESSKISNEISKCIIDTIKEPEKGISLAEKGKIAKMKQIVDAIKEQAIKEAEEKEKKEVISQAEEMFKLIESKEAKIEQIKAEQEEKKDEVKEIERKVEEAKADASSESVQSKPRSFFKRKVTEEVEPEPETVEETIEELVRTKDGKLVRIKRIIKRKIIKKAVK
ncbi:MAG: hypothetical protein QXT63_01990 [Thermoplasmata archaeon]